MKHLSFLVLAVLLFLLIWGCQEDSGILSTNENDIPSVESHGRFNNDGPFVSKDDDSQIMYEFEVTIENLCPVTGEKSSQPFSPPVIATHKSDFHMFRLGRYASPELESIAEMGNGQPMAEKLMDEKKVFDVVQGTGLILPGQSETFTIKSRLGAHKISFAAMLGITNDGFTGIDGMNLPRNGSRVYYLKSYDAGTEENTESAADLPALGGDGSPTTMEKIHYHPGIKGIADLDPAIFGWEDPVAKVTIKLVNKDKKFGRNDDHRHWN